MSEWPMTASVAQPDAECPPASSKCPHVATPESFPTMKAKEIISDDVWFQCEAMNHGIIKTRVL